MVILGIIIAASSSRLRDITVNARVSAAVNQVTSDIDQGLGEWKSLWIMG